MSTTRLSQQDILFSTLFGEQRNGSLHHLQISSCGHQPTLFEWDSALCSTFIEQPKSNQEFGRSLKVMEADRRCMVVKKKKKVCKCRVYYTEKRRKCISLAGLTKTCQRDSCFPVLLKKFGSYLPHQPSNECLLSVSSMGPPKVALQFYSSFSASPVQSTLVLVYIE